MFGPAAHPAQARAAQRPVLLVAGRHAADLAEEDSFREVDHRCRLVAALLVSARLVSTRSWLRARMLRRPFSPTHSLMLA
jgi:thiamine pyrophosphate-dependent acetolactate synthase large subunit-like protein